MDSRALSSDGICIQILQQWRRGQVFPFQAFIMLQFSWFSRAAGFMKINAILPDCFLRLWCALMHYETIQGAEISLPLSLNQQHLIRAVSGDFLMTPEIFYVTQQNGLEKSFMFGTLPSKAYSHLMASAHFAGKCCMYSTGRFCRYICSVRFQNHMLSFLFLGKKMETDSGQGILTRLEFSKAARDKSNWCNDNRTVSSLMYTVKSSSDGTLADGKLNFSWRNFHWRHGFTLVLYWLLWSSSVFQRKSSVRHLEFGFLDYVMPVFRGKKVNLEEERSWLWMQRNMKDQDRVWWHY